ncbi:MAG: hypothetical protein DCC46_07580 [Armatimonadetes bacterium]|nr:MAG: hypothetical protein DCC46_07580 [Armatimonadota bacterium]
MDSHWIWILASLTALLALSSYLALRKFRHETVTREGYVALLYRYGKLVRVVTPGRTVVYGRGCSFETVDVRARSFTVGNQEVVTSEGVPLRLSFIVRYRVADPVKYLVGVFSASTELYQAAQIAMRDALLTRTSDELLGLRKEAAEQVLSQVRSAGAEYGIEVIDLQIRDIVLGGDLKRAMAEKLKAQLEAQASLERARGEAATMRSLANTAQMIEKNPGLAQLRLLQAIESGNATVVIGADKAIVPFGG